MSRRGNGEGTIVQLTDGRWQARVTLPDGRRKPFYGKTRREAEQKLSEARASIRKGLSIPNERQTLETYLTIWLDTIKPTVKPTTWKRYHDLARLHLMPVLGRSPIARLTPQQVELLYAQKLAEGLSATTVHHLHAVLHLALEKAVRQGVVPLNVCDRVDVPRMERHKMQVYNPEEAKALLEAVAGDRFESLYVLALTTGMREGELLALRWDDVKLDRGTLSVRATLQNLGGHLTLGEPKTAHSRRQIRLTPRAVAALRAHHTSQAEERLRMGPAWQEQGLVFPNRLGGLMDGLNFLKQHYYPMLKKAGLQRIRFHDLRHTAATLLLRQGVNPKVVSEMLGHASVSITLDIYSHVLPDMQDAAVQAMEMALL